MHSMGVLHVGRSNRKISEFSNRVVAVSLGLVAVLAISGCSQAPNPEETIEQLTSVTEQPSVQEAPDEYDISVNPDPIVEPLECSPYLVVTARGTGEPSKGQLLSPVVRAIASARPEQVTSFDIDYPADDDVKNGGKIGARVLIDTLNQQAKICPEQSFVLLGYSQGAFIIGDALATPETRLIGEQAGVILPESSDRIAAIVLYGNPRFVGSEEYSVGSFQRELGGLLPRETGSLLLYQDRLRDYCVEGDFVCQSDFELDPEKHQAYYSNGMQADGAAFVITKLDPIDRLLSGPEPTEFQLEPAP